MYHIDRYVRETGKLFEDGSHIIYVNGNYKGDDEIGHLMQDFHQTDPDKYALQRTVTGNKTFQRSRGRVPDVRVDIRLESTGVERRS